MNELKSLYVGFCLKEGLANAQRRACNQLSVVFTPGSSPNHLNLFIQQQHLLILLVTHLWCTRQDMRVWVCLFIGFGYACLCACVCALKCAAVPLSLSVHFTACSLAVEGFIGGLIGSIDSGVCASPCILKLWHFSVPHHVADELSHCQTSEPLLSENINTAFKTFF